MEYEIVQDNNSLYSLQLKVQEMINDGWKPQGGVAMTKFCDEIYYSQAMIKIE